MLSKFTFKQGLKDGIPIALCYLSVSFAFGVQASLLGIPYYLATLISLTNLTSAGQLAGLTVMSGAGSLVSLMLTMAITQLVINARYFLMSISLSQKLDDSFTTPNRLLCSFAVTDEIFAVSVAKKGYIGTKYMLGLAFLPYFGWACGTLIGAILGNVLPAQISEALGIALYAMFIAIIIPPAMKSKGIALSIIISMGVSCLLRFVSVFSFLPSGLPIIISALVSVLIVSAFFPVKPNDINTAEPTADADTFKQCDNESCLLNGKDNPPEEKGDNL